jgi:hypothetical protein
LACHGCKDIILLERAPSVDYFEATKSFVYCVFPHGKDVLRDLGLKDIDHAGALHNTLTRLLARHGGRHVALLKPYLTPHQPSCHHSLRYNEGSVVAFLQLRACDTFRLLQVA